MRRTEPAKPIRPLPTKKEELPTPVKVPKSPAIPAEAVVINPDKPLTRAQRRALQFGHKLDDSGNIVATKGRDETPSTPPRAPRTQAKKESLPESGDEGVEEVELQMPRRPAPRRAAKPAPEKPVTSTDEKE